MQSDVFEDTALLCQRVNKQVGEVFSSPEMVMAKLIQNIFENKLQVHADIKYTYIDKRFASLRVGVTSLLCF